MCDNFQERYEYIFWRMNFFRGKFGNFWMLLRGFSVARQSGWQATDCRPSWMDASTRWRNRAPAVKIDEDVCCTPYISHPARQLSIVFCVPRYLDRCRCRRLSNDIPQAPPRRGGSSMDRPCRDFRSRIGRAASASVIRISAGAVFHVDRWWNSGDTTARGWQAPWQRRQLQLHERRLARDAFCLN